MEDRNLFNALDEVLYIGGLGTIFFYICVNSVVTTLIWFFWRRDLWSLAKELFISQYTFWTCIFCCEITHRCLLLTDEKSGDNILLRIFYYTFILFFVYCYTIFIAFILVYHICAEVPFKSERNQHQEKSLFDTLSYVFMYAAQDAVCLYIVYWFCPGMHTASDSNSNFEYFDALLGSLVIFPADLTFYVTHRYLLHGPCWSWHREHHEQKRPTIFSGRIFTLSDWFSEFTLSIILISLPVIYHFTVPTGRYNPYVMTHHIISAFYGSTMHHCGKPDVPVTTSMLIPGTEIYSLASGTSYTGLHEGHHNYVTKNFGIVGFSDRFMGTFKEPLNKRKINKKA